MPPVQHIRSVAGAFALAMLFVSLTPAPAGAQATTGEITGRVLDNTSLVLPGANVTLQDPATGFTRTTTTNEMGEYSFLLLPPGIYTVTVEMPGFQRLIRKDVNVRVGTRQTLVFEMEIGGLTEEVEVVGETPLIETTRSDLGGVVTPAEITNLPLLNRTFANLSVIMPEARPAGNFDPTKTRVGNVAMSGGDGRQLDVNVDGGDNKDNVVGSLLQNFAYESIQEFQVLQHRWTAEAGRAVGGVVNVITKSGSNTLRGSAFSTFRNQDTMARDFFQERGATKPEFERWEYGGSIGGRIVRDKLFFFGALERFDEPSASTPVRANVIPQLRAIPGASVVDAIPTPYDDTLLTVKVDHRMPSGHSMFYRFSMQKNSSPNDQVSSPATTDLTGGNENTNDLYDAVVNHTMNVGSSKLNQFTFHFQDFKNEILQVTDDPIMIFPSVRTGPAPNTPQQTTVRKWQLRDDFAWEAGSHSLRGGTNYIYTQLGGYFYFGAFGYQLTWFDDPLTITTNTARYPQGFATPGAVRLLDFFAGSADHAQNFHQLAFYAQDDWRVSQNLTLNLGLRWDANIDLLTDQTNNRTMQILGQLDDPLAQRVAGDAEKLARTTPSWTEFQPRVGFAYDPRANGRTVIRGGYGIFYDQIFQNLTIFSLAQSGPEIYSQILGLTNSDVGVGQAAGFRFGVDPLPPPPAFDFSQLPPGSFGRITDPDARDPYVHKASIGFQRLLGNNWTLSSDYVHTEGRNEPRVQVINPQIRSVCDPVFPGSTPGDPRCVRGASSRYFDASFERAGLGANRLGQINMIGTTNESKFDSWTTTLRGRRGPMQLSVSYVLAYSRGWGGQPAASYSGNGIAITPDDQFRPEEWGPTRHDERHRIVASGVFDLPHGFQVAPIVQFASSRPYTPIAGFDINGDGQTNIVDRLCAGVDLNAVFQARGDLDAVRALNPPGCRPAEVNSQRTGFVVNPDGTIDERSGRFFNADLRVAKMFSLGGRAMLKVYADLYNLFDTENLSFTLRPEQSSAASANAFMQPVSLYGPGFGPPVGRPFTASVGARIEF
ncbi:MAG: carboxypeptidase regulatory-like domain-containing protein [Vicinamibacterales bacterium]